MVLADLRSERFVDSSPATVWATLPDVGLYLCSERTPECVAARSPRSPALPTVARHNKTRPSWGCLPNTNDDFLTGLDRFRLRDGRGSERAEGWAVVLSGSAKAAQTGGRGRLSGGRRAAMSRVMMRREGGSLSGDM